MGGSMGDVAIFWDLDTCFAHPLISGFDVVGKIRALSQNLGTVRSFRGYADLVKLGIPSALHLRSELQSSGVSLIDCPTTERGSIASKTMIVDMLAHAADNPPPATLLVIAGNDDLAYAVSILQLRQYQVVLVCPKGRVGQHSQASLYLDWFLDVLGSDFPIEDDSPPPSRDSYRSRSSTTSTASTVPVDFASSRDGGVATPEPLAPGSPFNHSTVSSLSSILHEDPNDSIPRYSDFVDKKIEGETRNAEPPVEYVPSAAMDDVQKNELEQIRTSSPVPRIIVDVQHRPSSAPPSYSSFSLAPSPSPSPQDLYAPITFGVSRPPQYTQDHIYDPEVLDDFDNLISQPQSPEGTSASTITPWNGAHSPNSPITFTPSISQAHFSPDVSRPVLPTPQADLGLPLPSPFSVLPSTAHAPGPSPLTVPDTTGPPYLVTSTSFATPQSTSTSLPIRGSTPVSARTPTPAPARASTPTRAPATAATPTPAPSSLKLQYSPTKPPTQVRPPAPTVVPSQFRYLVKKLQECREKGDLKPFRPGLAAEMISILNKEMQVAGVSTFTQFVQLAEQAGVVELPRPGEGLWVALRPELYNYHVQ